MIKDRSVVCCLLGWSGRLNPPLLSCLRQTCSAALPATRRSLTSMWRCSLPQLNTNSFVWAATGFLQTLRHPVRRMTARVGSQNPLIRAVLQSKASEKPITGLRTPRRDIPISGRIASLLETPTWSVRSLLPDPNGVTSPEDTVTKEKLHHLLRLSALPPPKKEVAEEKLLKTLQAQIHFVKEIQKVDTTGIEPLRAIRDETAEAIEAETITLADLQPYLDKEERFGRNGRLRRRKDADEEHGEENAHTWNPFGMSANRSKKHGNYFVVKRPKKDTA